MSDLRSTSYEIFLNRFRGFAHELCAAHPQPEEAASELCRCAYDGLGERSRSNGRTVHLKILELFYDGDYVESGAASFVRQIYGQMCSDVDGLGSVEHCKRTLTPVLREFDPLTRIFAALRITGLHYTIIAEMLAEILRILQPKLEPPGSSEITMVFKRECLVRLTEISVHSGWFRELLEQTEDIVLEGRSVEQLRALANKLPRTRHTRGTVGSSGNARVLHNMWHSIQRQLTKRIPMERFFREQEGTHDS